ncbi:GNAT family N-acetyltransferase [Litoribacillus peritrichatus]|uniref:GNAT family N-acetyltransferase n=1 Tax=Litoribacillus peritrichatus TaxID=718191 RepID=A0ABP7N3E6_9GAMM
MSKMNIRQVNEQDLNRCYEIETAAYAGDEAASKSKILKRIKTYPEGFVVLENNEQILGFVNCGATHKVQLSDEEFKELVGHDAEGEHIVIMSVAIHPDFQGQGYASQLLTHFIHIMRNMNKQDIYLICQRELTAMYAKFGFVDLGPSESEHGGLSWHEMSLVL